MNHQSSGTTAGHGPLPWPRIAAWQGWNFVLGLAVGAVVVALGFWLWQKPPAPPADSAAVEQQALQGTLPAARSPAAPEAVTAISNASASDVATCRFEPIVPASTPADGRFQLAAALSARDRPDTSAFVAVSREAAGQGRRRDAEVALIAACRLAAGEFAPRTVPMADVQGQLGQFYAAAAALVANASESEALQLRARQLLEASAGTYTAVLGGNASKSRLASDRLAALARGTMSAGQALGASQLGSASEVHSLVGSDDELAQLDADLARLQAQAASVTRDPAGLERRAQQAAAQRDARCRDRACLLNWYAQRKRQLIDEF